MTIQEAVDLIAPAASLLPAGHPAHWADLGCGAGLFTSALARLLPARSTIYGVDTHPTLRQQDNPTAIISIRADFIKDPLDLPLLDGILMANSLHYVKDKPALIQKLRTSMHPGAPFILVEYDTDKPVTTWVPYPISYESLKRLFKDHSIQKIGVRPSAYGRANMYAALSMPVTPSSPL
ncbi:MAG TPA: methyltransferase [Puia sp.]|jgi:trans-aconitate methyltransferase